MAEWTPEDEADELEILARAEKDGTAPTWSKEQYAAADAALDAMLTEREKEKGAKP